MNATEFHEYTTKEDIKKFFEKVMHYELHLENNHYPLYIAVKGSYIHLVSGVKLLVPLEDIIKVVVENGIVDLHYYAADKKKTFLFFHVTQMVKDFSL